MSDTSTPITGLCSTFERAARVHEAARTRSAPPPASRQAASRQIAAMPQRTDVEQAIASAARQTSVDFDYLIAQAQVESAMNPRARARTSSATGLYQFIESTWLNTMQRHGERFGLGDVVARISVSQSGAAYVSDPATRAAILEMRNDPQIASLMAAGLAEDNRSHLMPILGRQPDHSELYLAHFLGAGGAGRFLSAMEQNPNQRADSLFRRPAAANRPVFYNRDGSARSLAGVMDYLSGRLERARANAPVSIPQGYDAIAANPPAYNLPDTSGRPPYLIADENVFGPFSPPILTGRNRPTIGVSDTIPLTPTRRPPISSLLADSINLLPQSKDSRSIEHIRKAYQQLKAFGL